MVGIAVLQVNLCVVSAPRILALLVLGANGKGGYSGGYSGGGLASKATRVWQGLGSMDVLAGFHGCPWIIFYWGCFRCFLPGNVLSQVAQFLCFFFWIRFVKLCCTGSFGSSSLANVFAALDRVLRLLHETLKTFKDSLGNNWQLAKRL